MLSTENWNYTDNRESKMRTSLKQIVVLAAVAVLGTGSTLASPPTPSPGAPDKDHTSTYLSGRASIFLVEIQKETGELLAEIQTETAELRPRAYTPWTFPVDPNYSRPSHSTFLDRAKGHISAVGKRIAELQRIRLFVLPWQRQATTEVTAHAMHVAGSIQAAIVHLRENQNRLFVSEYRDHLTTIAKHSGDMKQTVDKFLDYEKIPKEVHRLQTELELAGD
jgi:hypothetical protein